VIVSGIIIVAMVRMNRVFFAGNSRRANANPARLDRMTRAATTARTWIPEFARNLRNAPAANARG
jgi:hypothetical protein